jgi:hypothetical protein
MSPENRAVSYRRVRGDGGHCWQWPVITDASRVIWASLFVGENAPDQVVAVRFRMSDGGLVVVRRNEKGPAHVG